MLLDYRERCCHRRAGSGPECKRAGTDGAPRGDARHTRGRPGVTRRGKRVTGTMALARTIDRLHTSVKLRTSLAYGDALRSCRDRPVGRSRGEGGAPFERGVPASVFRRPPGGSAPIHPGPRNTSSLRDIRICGAATWIHGCRSERDRYRPRHAAGRRDLAGVDRVGSVCISSRWRRPSEWCSTGGRVQPSVPSPWRGSSSSRSPTERPLARSAARPDTGGRHNPTGRS